MRIAIIGSRNIDVDISMFIPPEATEIVTGGARGIDTLAERWADENNCPKLIIRPEYGRYGRSAPVVRNKVIVDVADMVVAVWDGKSPGTRFTIEYARESGKPVQVYLVK